MSGYTPGPWYFDGPDCAVGPVADKTIGVAAIMRVDGDSAKYLFGDESKANATLIAAAPDFLEALIECLPCLGWQHDDLEELQREHELGNDYAQLIIRARAAIAKAKGESQ